MKMMLEHVTKRYGETIAVNDVSLCIEKGELVALLGPSGCGKTTLLRTIAGLITLDTGRIYLNEREISTWSAQKRNTAMVFQNYALFPHLTVGQNIAYGLQVKGYRRQEVRVRVDEVLGRVKLAGFGSRQVHELSGGQQQRVALARALVVEPAVLLFDEPLSNLDEKLRVAMRQEIKEIQKELGITSIYVTHDQAEALSLADRIVVMNNGRVQQIGSPDDIYHQPANEFVARFIGGANLINLRVLSQTSTRVLTALWGQEVALKLDKCEPVKWVTCLLRPEEITFANNGIRAGVIRRDNLGCINRYAIEVEKNNSITVDVLNRVSSPVYNQGDEVFVTFSPHALHVIACH